MDTVLNLFGRSATYFYFTDPAAGGMTTGQQQYLINLLQSLRERYPILEINAVWDFGREEGDPVQGDKYGDFALSKDNAVYNAQMLTISYNHVRALQMPCRTPPEEITRILEEYQQVKALSQKAREMEQEMLQSGVPYPQILPKIQERLTGETGNPGLLAPGRENLLSLTDPMFAQVRAIRQLEDLQSLERLTFHEVGHLLSEQTGAVKSKAMKKLFAACRDGFENLYEFCAECFMAGCLTGTALPLAEEVRRLIENEGTGKKLLSQGQQKQKK